MSLLLPLQGLTALVTRPRPQGQILADDIERLGGKAILFPTLEIMPLADKTALIHTMTELDQFDIVIFISVNAVINAAPYWPTQLGKKLIIAGMGAATANALAQYNLSIDLLPIGSQDSEGLLNHPKLLQCKNKKILIISGVGGRPLLAETLAARGAIVTQLPVYQRVLPKQCYLQKKGDIILSASNESLQNLLSLIPAANKSWLLQRPLLVISQRMADFAQELGFEQPALIAADPSNAAVLAALKAWYARRF